MKNSDLHKETEIKLRKLDGFANSSFPILSIYVGSASKKSPSSILLGSQFHSLIHQNLAEAEQKKFHDDINRMERYILDEFDTHAKRSLAMFSAGKKLWESFSFEFYLPPLCVVSYSPYTKPITEALHAYNKYFVLLVDREKARLFTVHLGEIEEHKDVLNGAVPQNVRQINDAWMRQDKIFRHIEDHLHRHLGLIAQATSNFALENGIHFMVLGGHRQLLSKIKEHLPTSVAKMILGEFVSELNIPINDVLLHSKKVVEQLERDKVEQDMWKLGSQERRRNHNGKDHY